MQTTTENKTNRPFKNPAVEARRRLRETIPHLQRNGLYPAPFLFSKNTLKTPKKSSVLLSLRTARKAHPALS